MTSPELSRRGEREREILDAAAKLFRERGYSSTTIRDIGVGAGLNHATSHYYFGSKAGILFAIFQEAIDGFLLRINQIAGPPDAALTEIVKAAVIEAARRPDQTAVFFQERHWLEQLLPPDMCNAIRERQEAFRVRVVTTVEEGVKQRLLKDIDPMVVVETIVGMATWAYKLHSAEGAASLDAATQQCAELLIDGLRAETTPVSARSSKARRSKSPQK